MTPQELMRSKEIEYGDIFKVPSGKIKIDDAIAVLEAYGKALRRRIIAEVDDNDHSNKELCRLIQDTPEPDMGDI